jgi:hypothetical protein
VFENKLTYIMWSAASSGSESGWMLFRVAVPTGLGGSDPSIIIALSSSDVIDILSAAAAALISIEIEDAMMGKG